MSIAYRLSRIAATSLVALALGCSSTSGPDPEAAAPAPPEPELHTNGSSGVSSERVSLDAVYFATDDASLRPDARSALERVARVILEHPEWGVLTVEGHCDERGSDAYNQALGDRRARAVERFLVAQGVPAERLETRSFGSTQPAVAGHDEHAWRLNRRSEIDSDAIRTASR
jgi:peptidoglycan-associated lipoprotein